MTIEQLTQLLKLDALTVYGLMAFLVKVGAASAKNAPSNGKRGKPPKLYTLADNAPGMVADWVATVQLHQAAQPVVETPTTHDVVAASPKLEDDHSVVTV